jgi:acyl-CoA dehydrogenase
MQPTEAAFMFCVGYFALMVVGAIFLGFFGAPLFLWSIAIAALLWLVQAPLWLCVAVGVMLLIANIPLFRRVLVSNLIMTTMKKLKLMPVISETERVAIEAGSSWVDAELFSGKPNYDRIRKEPYKHLNEEEQKFIDGPVEELCRMVTDWEIYNHRDLPKPVWDFLKKERFFGMIVPKEFGGLGFSARAQSEVVAMLASHSTTLCVTVMVPNSLGPAELLAHYGTDKQKAYYLPRLARGEEIPCFALTEPNAGSDAGSITSSGEVFKGEDDNLYVKLNWDKRYITLASVSTLIGLAIKLKDPHNLLGKGKDVGITCVLVPSATAGVELGQRHNPMGVPFHNCPTKGKDVVVSIEQLIGGLEGAGRGWQMLMECLAAGRAISLPSQAAGGIKALCRVTSAYAAVRRQFGVQIGHFEGIEEPLARIIGLSYMMEAARVYTVGAVDSGLKPAVISAISKYTQTELARKAINDAMDIMGGSAISRGPRNQIANAYIGTPISITVEGANILTRCMIIFGQGALRCHPFAYKEVKALATNDHAGFDKAFWGHIGHVVRNLCRSVVLSLSRGHLAVLTGGHGSGPSRRYYRKLSWASASFAIMADIAMASFGGQLKLKEKLTGRYADILSWMYFAAATLRRYEADGFRKDHEQVFDWAMQYCLARIQEAFDGIFANFDVPFLGMLFRGPIYFWSRLNTIGTAPSDSLGHAIARAIQVPGVFRDSLTEGIPSQTKPGDIGFRFENALDLSVKSAAILKRITAAIRKKQLPKKRATALVKEAQEAGIISAEEAALLKEANASRDEAVAVDSFSLDEFEPNLLDLKRS